MTAPAIIKAGPFAGLGTRAYGLILADPPWRFATRGANGDKKSPQAHYDCPPYKVLRDLPVLELAAADCALVMWATNPHLELALHLMRSWGFAYKTGGHWIKTTKNGLLAFGPGYILRGAGEPILVGTKGSPSFGRRTRSILEGRVREHSRKPDEQYRWCEGLVPGVKRVELFARQRWPDWHSWGNEKGKFS